MTTSSGQHHLRMAGFKLQCVCVCVYVRVCVCVRACVCVRSKVFTYQCYHYIDRFGILNAKTTQEIYYVYESLPNLVHKIAPLVAK